MRTLFVCSSGTVLHGSTWEVSFTACDPDAECEEEIADGEQGLAQLVARTAQADASILELNSAFGAGAGAGVRTRMVC